MNPRDVVIVSACRTPIGKNMGQFKDVRARQLAITAGAEAIKRADIDPKLIDGIVMGECFTAMEGSLAARQVSMRLGFDERSNACVVTRTAHPACVLWTSRLTTSCWARKTSAWLSAWNP